MLLMRLPIDLFVRGFRTIVYEYYLTIALYGIE